MKLLGLWLAFASLLLAFEYGLKPQKVGEGIYCYFGKPEAMDRHNNGNMVNSCFVDMGKEWLVIDSGPTYLYAKEASEQIFRIKPLPIKLVINTHVHDDHWLGNGYYKQHGATILGSQSFDDINVDQKTRMQNRISEEAYQGTTPVLPKGSVKADQTITIAGETVILKRAEEKAHTEEDIYVYLPSRKALFAGDLVFNDRLPSLRDGDINGWISALEEIKSMDTRVLVGGHGFRTDKDSLNLTLNYLKELKRGILEILYRGGDITDAVKELTMPSYSKEGMYEELHKANINAAFQMLEWSDE
jgi:glyoxylase-like metal-dependent hydrolase (beta-lactamase superfamily II)